MVRLPDVGFSEWIADQQAEFQKSTAGHFDALEFRDAASQLEELIPKDFPTIGGEDTWEEEQRRIQEAEQRRQEQEAAIREAELNAQQAAWMQQQQEAEAARQRDLMMQAHQEASSYGIPTPNDVFNEFAGLEGKPLGTGNPEASSGVFDAADQAPPPVAPTLDAISPDQALSEFSSIAPQSPKERLLQGVDPQIGRYDFGAAANTLSSIPGQISDVASSIPGQVSSAASTIWDAIPSGEQIMEMDRGIREYPIRKPIELAENMQKNASAVWDGNIKPFVDSASTEVDKLSPLYERAKTTAAEASRVRAEAGLPPIIDLDPTHLPIQESARTPAVRAADLAAVQAANDLVGAGLTAPLNVLADAADREPGFSPIVAPLRREAEKFAPTWKKAADASYELEQARAEAGMGAVPALNIFPDRDADRQTEKTRAAEAKAMQASREMLSQGGHGALKGLADATDAALANIGWDRESREVSGGIGEQLGFGKIGVADLIVNLAPTKALNAVQWADVGASLIDAPTDTGASLGILGALMAGAKYLPKQTITLIGGLAAGIESVYSQRDIDFSGDYTLRDTLLQSLGGTAAGATVATGTKPAIGAINRTVANTIRAIAASPTLEEALTRLDVAGGRALDLMGEGGSQALDIARKYPAVATALGITGGAAVGDMVGDYLNGSSPDQAASTPSIGAGAVVGGMAAVGGKAGAVDAAVQAGRKLAPTFYSVLEQVVKDPKVPARVTPDDLSRIIEKSPVKADELKWTNFDDWLAEQKAAGAGLIRKSDVLDYLEQNKVEVKEIEYRRPDQIPERSFTQQYEDSSLSYSGNDVYAAIQPHRRSGQWQAEYESRNGTNQGDIQRFDTQEEAQSWLNGRLQQSGFEPIAMGDQTKFSKYREAGGKNYRELLLTLPDIPPARTRPAPQEYALDVDRLANEMGEQPGLYYLLDDQDEIAGVFNSQAEVDAALRSVPENERALYRSEFEPANADADLDEAFRIMDDGTAYDDGGATNLEDLRLDDGTRFYRGGHWNQDNVLAHVRFDDRVGPNGERILMIDEIQSDWHQTGRREGYGPRQELPDEVVRQARAEINNIWNRVENREDQYISAAEQRRLSELEMVVDSSGTPEGPFQGNWQALALKRMLRYAAENNYDRIEWWSGQPHAERWGTQEISWQRGLPSDENGFAVMGKDWTPVNNVHSQVADKIQPKYGQIRSEDDLFEFLRDQLPEFDMGRKEIAEHKDIAAKLWKQMQEQPEGTVRPREEGLHYFYDKSLPQEMNNLAKKFNKDNRVTTGEMAIPEGVGEGTWRSAPQTMKTYGINVTPEMKNAVLYEGQPQFVALPPGLAEAGAGAAAGSQSEEDSSFSAGGALLGAALGVNMAKLPKNGPWQERLARGLEVPEGATPRIKNMLNRAYGEAMRLLEKSQTVSGASRKIRFHTMADEAYRAYEKLLSSGSPEGAARVAETPRPLRGAAPERVSPASRPEPAPEAPRAPRTAEEAALADMGEDAYPFGQGPDVPPASRPVPSDQPGVAGVADEFTVDPEPLPDVLNPDRVIDQTQFKTVVANLQEDMAMNPKHVQALNDAVVKIMMAEGDIKGKHVDKLVRWAGNLRALPRGMTKEEAIDQYAQRQLEKAGLISSYGSRAVPDEAMSPAVKEISDALPTSPPSAANAAVGAGLGSMTEDDDEGYSWEAMAGGALVGSLFKKKLNPNLVKDLKTIEDDLTRSFRTPNQGVSLKGPKFSERAYDFWQSANVHLFDELGRLQGYQNDLAREFQKQTGMRLPAEMLFAELKRFDFSNRAKIDVTEYIKYGAVKKLNEAGVPQEEFDRYLMARQNVDILRAQQAEPPVPGKDSKKPYVGDLTRQFPGSSSYEAEVKYLQDAEAIHKKNGTWDAVQGAAEDVWALSGRMLDLLHGGGLIDKEAADYFRAKYPHFVPTRILEKLGDDSFTPPSKSMSINSNQIRDLTLEGTSKDTLNPTAAMTAAIYQVHAAVQKNLVANAFVDAWDTASGRINTFDDASGILSEDGVKAAGQFIPDLTTDIGRRIQRHVDGIQPWPVNDAVPAGWSPLTNFRNGVKEKFIVSDELAPLINFAKPDNIKVVSSAMNFFRQAVTTRNPVFLASNMFLDLSSFLIREGSRAGGPQHMGEAFGEWTKAMLEFVASPAAWADMGEGRYSGDMARALMQGGGMSGGYFPGGVQPAKKIGVIDWIDGKPEDIDAMLKKYNLRDTRSPIVKEVENMRRGAVEINTAGGVARMMKDMLTFKPVETIGERIEAAPRVAAMRLSEKRIDKTLSLLDQERARTAEAISGLDQSPGSGIGQKLKDLGLRSLDSIDAEIKDTEARRVIEGTQAYRTTTIDFNKGGTFSRFVNQIIPFFNVGMQSIADVPRAFAENKVGYPATVMTGVMMPVILAEEWNNMDSQRAKDYADIPAYIKDQGLVVMLPGEAPVDEKGNRMPRYFHLRYRQLAPIAALTREMLQQTWYREQLPAENEQRGVGEVAGSAISMVSPVPVDNAADFAVGLVPPILGTSIQAAIDRDLFRDKRVVSEFADDRASPLSKAIYEYLDKPDSMRPSMVEFITRDAGGGYAKFWHGVANMLDGRKSMGVTGIAPLDAFADRFVKSGGGGKSQIAREHLLTPSAEEVLKKHNVNWRPSPVDYKIGDVPLTLSEYGDYQREVNIAVDKTIQETSRKADFLVKSPGEKEAMLERSVGFAKEAVRNKFLSRIPTAERAKRRKLEDEKEKKGWTGVWSDPPSSTSSSSSTSTSTTQRSAPTRSSPIIPATRP